MKEYVLIKDLVIPAGTKLSDAPSYTERYTNHHECIIDFGKDAYGSFTVDIESDDDPVLREYFRELK